MRLANQRASFNSRVHIVLAVILLLVGLFIGAVLLVLLRAVLSVFAYITVLRVGAFQQLNYNKGKK